MTLLIHDGFDNYNSIGEDETKGPWDTQSQTSTLTSGVRTNATGYATTLSTNYKLVHVPDVDQAGKTIYMGGAIKYTSVGSTDVIKIAEGTTYNSAVQLVVRFEVDTMKVYRGDGTTLLGTGIYLIEEDTWYYFEFKINIHNTTGSFELKIGGNVDISLSGIDTQEQTTDSVQAISFVSTYNSIVLDDVYICNSDGSLNNGYLGECVSKPIFPNGDNTITWSRSGGVTNYENVDETFDSDGDTSYVYSETAAQQDLYDMQNLANVDTGIVYGVRVNATATKEGYNWESYKFGIKSGATTQLSSEYQMTDRVYTYNQNIYETSDGATTAWTETTFNAALLVLENQ